jgi:hypothetical protein
MTIVCAQIHNTEITGPQFYKRVRASMILRGTSFNAWCHKREYKYQNVRAACLGEWTGPRAQQICAEIDAWISGEDAA